MYLFFQKKKLIAVGGTLLIIAAVVSIAIIPRTADAYLMLPFEGKIINIEYNCICSGSIMLTIQPTISSIQYGAVTQQMLFVWAAEVLDELLDLLGIQLPLPLPSAYLWCQIYRTGNQQLVGTYIQGAFPCAAYTGNGCAIRGYATGAIFSVGTSLF